MLSLQFHGAAREVTGSSHLLWLDRRLVLLDCGLYQGRRSESRERNTSFPVDPSTIHSVVLSHAHIDHSGNLPQLARQRFNGPIYSTGATAQLCALMLRDSAHIQESDTRFLNKKRARRHEPPVEPLYKTEDAEKALELFIGMPYGRPFHVLRHLKASFHHAGHILGAASVMVECDEGPRSVRLGFSGDVGRSKHPFLRSPAPMEDIDYLIMESTYGDRLHPPDLDLRDALLRVVKKVVDRKGKLIIPAFSVGRTQLLVYHLNDLWNRGMLPRVPVYVDSPLSTNVTEIFRQRYECCSDELRATLLKDDDPFGFDTLTYVRDAEKSKALNEAAGPMIIISASGMCEAGRVLHHLAHGVGDEKNLVLIVGFMAEHTLGRKLMRGDKTVKIFGEETAVRCEVETLNGFSAHGDQSDLVNYALGCNKTGRLRKIFLVHGEEDSQAGLKKKLNERMPNVEVLIPARGERFDLNGS
jgi:metallo-beta-lactamase family protein